MKAKKPRLSKFLFRPSTALTLLLVLMLAFVSVTVAQNKKIHDLQQKLNHFQAANGDEDQKMLPVCERDADGMSVAGGNGVKVMSLHGTTMEIEGYEGSTFHICNNVKVYDVVQGGEISINEVKTGSRIWFKTTEANYIKEIQLVSRESQESSTDTLMH